MHLQSLPRVLALLLAAFSIAAGAACGSADSPGFAAGGGGNGTAGSGTIDGAGGGISIGASATSSGSGAGCDPPDVLIVLDRTESMHKEADGDNPMNTLEGHKTSKWYLAVDAIEKVAAPPMDTSIRLGLELFPQNPGGDKCVTLAERIEGIEANNPGCEEGEVLIEPNLSTGSAIAAALDPEVTPLCHSTPISAALATAKTELERVADPTRKQFVLLVTDGQDTCAGKSKVVEVVQDLAQRGVATYVVGFGAGGGDGVNPELLNDLACAGLTAKDTTACEQAQNGYVASDPSGPTLYYDAADGAALLAGLEAIASRVCCNCIPN